MGYGYYGFPVYVSVADRKRNAQQQRDKLLKKGKELNPILIEGRAISQSFWGKAWCKHLETFKDQENRLGRGRSYLRSHAVIDLVVKNTTIHAKVSGSSLYDVSIAFSSLPHQKWQNIVKRATGKIDSLLDLLKGTFSKEVMQHMIDIKSGLFPSLRETTITCSCPDRSSLCKHSAAALYGIGHRLDTKPELLFTLRGVNHLDLLKIDSLDNLLTGVQDSPLEGDLSAIFGINLGEETPIEKKTKPSHSKTRKIKKPT